MVFGKPLTSQAVIRAKLASMISRVEGCQNWLETITYQMNNVRRNIIFCVLSSEQDSSQMSYNEMSSKLAGPIALLKQYT
jgi:hypothetical protein